MSRAAKAERFISKILSEYPNSIYPAMTEAAAQSAIELAYHLGDIGDKSYDDFNQRLRRMTDRKGVAA
ncbi:hypothetical protein [Pseudomonas eucalypticola]|uniref:Uncharacterized protein n=1 Tax=Pseudomonas eucalypticola TaxID=2599595 RepID=A0A7D5D8W9_9PSED|nr:hypothetical protein [Pseudomonas eucalypticola]QKZ05860.1 hypothetical protein HWQ56_19525 [Pseudomonas eucalypticola]